MCVNYDKTLQYDQDRKNTFERRGKRLQFISLHGYSIGNK